jgi:hypothetical protein
VPEAAFTSGNRPDPKPWRGRRIRPCGRDAEDREKGNGSNHRFDSPNPAHAEEWS